jgi:hypothetical protein
MSVPRIAVPRIAELFSGDILSQKWLVKQRPEPEKRVQCLSDKLTIGPMRRLNGSRAIFGKAYC